MKYSVGILVLYLGWSFCSMRYSLGEQQSSTGKSQMYGTSFYTVFNFFKLSPSSSRKDSLKKSSIIYFGTASINLLMLFNSSFKFLLRKWISVAKWLQVILVCLLFWQSNRGHQHFWVVDISTTHLKYNTFLFCYCFVQCLNSVLCLCSTLFKTAVCTKDLLRKRGHVSLLNITRSHCI